MQETWVRSLGHEDSPGEGDGSPLQCSCLENPVDRGAWKATVHGVTENWTPLHNCGFQSVGNHVDSFEAGGIEGRLFHFMVDICLAGGEFM